MNGRCLGVDVGGTFTDFVIVGPDGLRVDKRLSSPRDPAESVLAGLAELDPSASLPVVHGTTVATNALLERRGARTAFVTSAGFGDLLALGRAARGELYALEPRDRPNLVPPESDLVFELDERVDAAGLPLRVLTDAEIDRVARALAASGAESVAVCLLFSYLHPEHERRFAAALDTIPGAPAYRSLSVDVLPEFREYERASTTVVNAYVMPLVARYLARLERAAAPRPLAVMGSHAGSLPPETAARLSVSTILSGPAGGVLGALAVARRVGWPRCISFDMGGTSTDVALCDDALPFTSHTQVGGLPVRRPSVDVHTVGAGGGSIVGLDAAGGIRVGPESAGAEPGPAAYGRGGRQPTLTDAQVILGRLPEAIPLAGGIRLDADAARRAFAGLAAGLGCDLETAALGALRVAEALMERALRQVSVLRGEDPADYAVLAFGGAGGLHACALAEAIGTRRVILPGLPGALSALGLATAAPVATVSRSVLRQPGASTLDLERAFAEMRLEAMAQLGPSGEGAPAEIHRQADLRYAGQSWELVLDWPDDGNLRAAFERAHAARYGFLHAERSVELVTLRLRATAAPPAGLPLRASTPQSAGPADLRWPVVLPDGLRRSLEVLRRGGLRSGDAIVGPCLIHQPDSTLFVAPGWQGRVVSGGEILLERP